MSDRPVPIPALVARPLEPLYAAAVAIRNRRYDRGRGVVTLDRPVISVGNLTVGGTGKTPMVLHLVRRLCAAGRHPCIAMRGYRSAGTLSDEAALYQEELGGVPVVARADRVEGLIDLFATSAGSKVDCIVLDDGFQHRRLARQLDVVMVDATRDPFFDRLLPAGSLREPIASLRRARWVVLSHAESAPQGAVYRLGLELRKIDEGIRIAITRHVWTELLVETPVGVECHEPRWLRKKNIVAVCAIGNPGPFLAEVERAVGAANFDRIVLRDHDPYGEATMRRIMTESQGCDAVVTTAKDWTKLGREPIANWPCPVVRPHLELVFDSGRDELEREVIATAGSRPP